MSYGREVRVRQRRVPYGGVGGRTQSIREDARRGITGLQPRDPERPRAITGKLFANSKSTPPDVVPTLTVIAGQNGAGKTRFTGRVDLEGRERLLHPNAITRELNSADPDAAASASGRETLRRAAAYLDSALSFVIENTLSGRLLLGLMREAKSRGWEIHLVFLCIDSPERSIERIRTRALLGGHSVPEEGRALRRHLAIQPNAAPGRTALGFTALTVRVPVRIFVRRLRDEWNPSITTGDRRVFLFANRFVQTRDAGWDRGRRRPARLAQRESRGHLQYFV